MDKFYFILQNYSVQQTAVSYMWLYKLKVITIKLK
jgi:hypothetical protein